MRHMLKLFLRVIHGRIYKKCKEQISDNSSDSLMQWVSERHFSEHKSDSKVWSMEKNSRIANQYRSYETHRLASLPQSIKQEEQGECDTFTY